MTINDQKVEGITHPGLRPDRSSEHRGRESYSQNHSRHSKGSGTGGLFIGRAIRLVSTVGPIDLLIRLLPSCRIFHRFKRVNGNNEFFISNSDIVINVYRGGVSIGRIIVDSDLRGPFV